MPTSVTFTVGATGDFATIALALAAANINPADEVIIAIADGTYDEDLTIARAGVTLQGSSNAIIDGTIIVTGDDTTLSGVTIANGGSVWGTNAAVVVGADNLTVTGVTFDGAGNTHNAIETAANGATGMSVTGSSFEGWNKGIWVNPGMTDLLVTGNSFDGNNNGMAIDGPNVTGDVSSNNFVSSVGSHIGMGIWSAGTIDASALIGANTFGGTNSQVSLFGTGGDDTLIGTDGPNRFFAEGGNDVIHAGADDTVDGGAGTDTVIYAEGTDPADVVAGSANITGAELIRVDGTGGDTFIVLNGMSIQAAINLAAAGDTIIVGDGVFNENIQFTTAGITLKSLNGRDSTSIVGSDANPLLGTVHINAGANDVTIEGFTIEGVNGNGAIEKGAIYIQGNATGLTIRNNDIVAKGDSGLTAQFGVDVSNALIDGNIFSGKTFVGANPESLPNNTFGFDPGQFTPGSDFPRQLVVMGNGGSGPSVGSNVTFTNNQLTGTTGGISSVTGLPFGNNLVTIDVPDSTISGNDFTGFTGMFTAALRARRDGTDIQDNLFDLSDGGQFAFPNSMFLQNNTTGTVADNRFIDANGNEWFPGGAGNETIVGTEGDDMFLASAGNDDLDGAGGSDTLDMAAAGTGGAFVDLNAGLAFSSATGIDSLANIENVIGSSGNDGLYGDDNDNVFTASGGSDVIDGRGGSDTFDASAATNGISVNLTTGVVTGGSSATLTSVENVLTGSGSDVVVTSAADNRVETGAGNDSIAASAGNDVIDGGDGDDTVSFTGNRADYTITWDGTTATVDDGNGNITTITDVGLLAFGDQNVFLVDDSSAEYATIAAALTDAADGDEIMVGTGSYAGVTIDKDVTISGVKAGTVGYDVLETTGVARDAANETVMTSGFVVLQGLSVVIDGFRFENTNAINTNTGFSSQSITFKNNVIIGGSNQYFGNAGDLGTVIISGNYINSTNGNGLQVNSFGNGDVSITDNLFNGTGAGAAAVNANGIADFLFSGNVVLNTNSHGIQVAGDMGTVTIDGNTFDGTVQSGAQDRGAISVFNPQAFSGDLTITDNTVTDSPFGVVYRGGPDADSTTITITLSGNDFAGATVSDIGYAGTNAANVLTGGAEAATFRGFDGNDQIVVGGGNDTVDGGAGLDTVTFAGDRDDYTITWDGTSATVSMGSESVTITNAGRLDFGDKDVLLVAAGTEFATVQAGVNAAVTGDEVLIAEGTYSENVTIDGKSISLIGATTTTAPLAPAAGVVIAGQISTSGLMATDDVLRFANLSIDATGQQYGLFLRNSATDVPGINGGSIIVDGVTIENARANGMFYAHPSNGSNPINVDTVGTIEILNSVFATNGEVYSGARGHGHVNLFGFNGNLTVDGVSMTSTDTGLDDSGFRYPSGSGLGVTTNGAAAYADKALSVTGIRTGIPGVGGYADAGDLVLNDITINGRYSSDVLSFYTIGAFASIAISGVDIDASARWSLVNFDSVSGPIDLSTGLTLNNSSLIAGSRTTELQGLATDDELTGTDGIDILFGRGGADSLYGGAGNDVFLYTDAAQFATGELLDGGDGYDSILFTGAGTLVLGEDITSVEQAVIGHGLGAGLDASAMSEGITLSGGAGNDTLIGGAGADMLHGNEGNDTFSYADGSLAAADTLHGGDGLDVVAFTGATGTLTMGANVSGVEEINVLSGADVGVDASAVTYGLTINGGEGANTLTGTGSADSIDGGTGNDTLIGGGGNDTLNGGDDTDTADYSGSGAAVFANLLLGTAFGSEIGNDTLISIEAVTGGAGNDALVAGNGGNRLDGGAGNDSLTGGTGNDTLIAGAGVDVLVGGDGSDTAEFALDWAAYAISQTGSTFTIGEGSNSASVTGVETFIFNGVSYTASEILNLAPDDILFDDEAPEVAENDAGAEITRLDATDPNTGDSVTLSVNDTRFEIVAAEPLSGLGLPVLPWILKLKDGVSLDHETAGTVTLTITATDSKGAICQEQLDVTVTDVNEAPEPGPGLGTWTPDAVETGAIGAALFPEAGITDPDGDDLVYTMLTGPSAGRLLLNGVEVLANDTLSGADLEALVFETLGVAVGLYDATFEVTDGEFTQGLTLNLNVVAGTDRVYTGTAGNDTLDGADGFDTVFGLGGEDQLYGGIGRDRLFGGSGSDTLFGGNGNDTLRGGQSADALFGGNGNDLLDGGDGFDTLEGGAGTDTFVLSVAAGDYGLTPRVLITDFETGVDKVDLSAYGLTFVGASAFSNSGLGQVRFTGINDRLIIDFDGDGLGDLRVQFGTDINLTVDDLLL